MRRALLALALFAVSMALPLVARAETTVSVRIDPETVEVNQRFDYLVEVISSASEGISFESNPDFGELRMLGSGKRTSFRPGAGSAARQFTVNFTLVATETGTFEIAPPVVKVGNRTFKLPKREVKVVGVGDAPKQSAPKSGPYAIEASVLPERDPYVGEQITVDYKLLRDATSPRVQPQPPNEPSLDDFWIEDLTDGNGYRQRTVLRDGKHYEQMSLRVYGLFPLKAGPASIEPMTVDLQVGGFFQRPQSITVESEPIELDVQPLPPNAPAGFDEANVGEWSFSTRVDHRATRVGRPITLELVVEGTGHVDRFVLPEVDSIPGARVTHRDEDVRRHRGSQTVGGRKIARISLMPTEEGKLEIPSMTFHYFDPDAGAYRTQESNPIEVAVGAGVLPEETTQKRAEARASTDGEDVISGLSDSLLPPRRDPGDDAPASPFGTWWFWVLVVLPALGLVGLAIERPARRARARRSPARARAAARDNALEQLDEVGGADDLYGVIRHFVNTRFDIPSGRITADEVAAALRSRGVRADHADQCSEFLAELEHRRFGGGPAALSSSEVDRARKLVDTLDKESSKANGAANVAVWLLAAAIASFIVPDNAYANLPDEAQSAWDKGEFASAAKTWAEAAEAATLNATLHFNAGTAHARSEAFGPARLYLERAALLAPFEQEISDQLDTVRRIVRLRAIESSRSGKTLDGDEPLFWWRLGASLAPTAVAIAIVLGMWLAFGAALLRRFTFTSRPAARDAAFVGFVLGVSIAGLGITAASLRTAALDSVRPAVIMTTELSMREGPSTHARELDVPRSAIEGTVVRIVEERGAWTKIALPGEVEGWTARDAVEAIERRP
jgi:hypothetical protein